MEGISERGNYLNLGLKALISVPGSASYWVWHLGLVSSLLWALVYLSI